MTHRPRGLGFLAAVAAVGVLAAACGAGNGHRAAGAPPPSRSSPGATATSTTSTTTPPTTPAPTTTVDAGALPQTTAQPSDNSPAVSALAAQLWQAVVTDDPVTAFPSFFPLGAYEQLKALSDDATDYQTRLVAHFELDVAAAHNLLGAGARTATLMGLDIPASYVRWVPPGACYNHLGYWFVPGSRMVYNEDGTVRSFGIAALDSWRGQWYIIHLGSELPPAYEGVVDAPSAGVGYFGSPGGC